MYVEALAPGIDVDSLDLAVIQNVLSIAGEKRRTLDTIPPEAFHRNERAVGKFVRTVDLPAEVDADQVKAAYQNGLLMVTLAKAAAAKPKHILTIRGQAAHGLPGEPTSREYELANDFRQFELSAKVDKSKIAADLKQGVLTLTLSKVVEAQPRKIAAAVS